MPKQYFIPGRGYFNDGESGVQRLLAGFGYLTDATPPPVVGSAAVVLADAGKPSLASVNARQYFMRGNGYANDLGLGLTRMLGLMGVLSEVEPPVLNITGTAAIVLSNFTCVAGVETFTGTVAVTLDNFVCAASGSLATGGTVAVTLGGVYPYAFGGENVVARAGMVALSSNIRSMGELV